MGLDGESDLSPQYRLALTLTGDKSLSKLVDAGKTRCFYPMPSGSGKFVRKRRKKYCLGEGLLLYRTFHYKIPESRGVQGDFPIKQGALRECTPLHDY